MREKRKKNQRSGRINRRVSHIHNEEPPHNPYLKAALLEMVEEQVRYNDPPETRQTLERLLDNGYLREQAIEMIASALVEELWHMLKGKEFFDHARYTALLDQLG